MTTTIYRVTEPFSEDQPHHQYTEMFVYYTDKRRAIIHAERILNDFKFGRAYTKNLGYRHLRVDAIYIKEMPIDKLVLLLANHALDGWDQERNENIFENPMDWSDRVERIMDIDVLDMDYLKIGKTDEGGQRVNWDRR